MQKEQRVAVLVDFPNISRSVFDAFGGKKIDISFFHGEVRDRHEIRAIAYTTNGENTEKFHHVLYKNDFEVKKLPSNGEADCDVWLAVDAIALADKVDTIIIASGDGDYVTLVRFLKAKGVKVEVMAVEQTASFELMKEADRFVRITQSMVYNNGN